MSTDAPQAHIPQAEVELDESAVAAVEAEAGPLPADRFLDRELSWLAFNERVLQLSEDPDLAVLERAKFIAIFASNLDEFFMVRVAGLKRRIATGIAVRAASGLTPREVLEAIWSRAHLLQLQQAHPGQTVSVQRLEITQSLLLLLAGLAHPLGGAIEIALLLLLLLQVVVGAQPGKGPGGAVDRHHQIRGWAGAGLAHQAALG